MTQAQTTARLLPFALASGVACALSLGLGLLSAEPTRTGIVFGSCAAALSALCALSALSVGVRSGTSNGVLGAFAIGFLCRAVLVGVGLVVSGVRGNAALAYAFAFFALFGVTQLIEILFVHASAAKSAKPGAHAVSAEP